MAVYRAQNPEGTFALAHHTPSEWAAATADRLIALGCSKKYARAVGSRIRDAVKEPS